MGRKSPLDAAFWTGLLEEGEVRCRGCDTFVDLEAAEEVNDAIQLWNEHVNNCSGVPEETTDEGPIN